MIDLIELSEKYNELEVRIREQTLANNLKIRYFNFIHLMKLILCYANQYGSDETKTNIYNAFNFDLNDSRKFEHLINTFNQKASSVLHDLHNNMDNKSFNTAQNMAISAAMALMVAHIGPITAFFVPLAVFDLTLIITGAVICLLLLIAAGFALKSHIELRHSQSADKHAQDLKKEAKELAGNTSILSTCGVFSAPSMATGSSNPPISESAYTCAHA